MDSLVFCPDCGGVIGGRSPEGVKLCTCEVNPTVGPRPGMPNPVEKPKVCCHCGKDLLGKKRFKDSLGYWCEACHYSEKREEMRDHTPCDECGRYVEGRKLTEFEGLKICSRCLAERKSRRGKRRWRVTFGSEHEAHEKRTLMFLAVAAALLLLIILFASMGWLPAWI